MKKGVVVITKKNKGINLTAIAGKVYYALLFHHIHPEVLKAFRKIQNFFRSHRLTTSHILTTQQIIKEDVQKYRGNSIVCAYLIPYTEMNQILFAYGFRRETVTALMRLNKKTKSIVRLHDDTRIIK